MAKKKTEQLQAGCRRPLLQRVPRTARVTRPVIKFSLISHPQHTQVQGLRLVVAKTPVSNKAEQVH